MMRAYVKNLQGAWLVEGAIGNIHFSGNGRAFAFKQKDADLLCETFGYTQQPAKEAPDGR